MRLPESLFYYRLFSVLFKAIPSRRRAKHNIRRKKNRKFLPWYVIGPPCLYQVLHILKSFHRFSTILSIGVPFSSHQELSSAVSLPVVQNTLHSPCVFVIIEHRCWFSLSSFWEWFIILTVVRFDYRIVENFCLPPTYSWVHANCVVLGALITFNNNKGSSRL